MFLHCIQCPNEEEFIQNQFTGSVLPQEAENESTLML